MSRSFASASLQHLVRTSAVVSAYPITMACWINMDNVTASTVLMALGNSASANGHESLWAMGSIAGDPIRAVSENNSGTSAVADSTSGYSSGTWAHACAVFSANNSRAAYINGGSKGTNTTSIVFPTVNRTAIAALVRSSTQFYSDGDIAEAAIWDVALTDADVAALATRISPVMVKPGNLVAYWPLIGRYDPEIEIFGAADLTVQGSAPVADHPRVIYPHRRPIGVSPVAASTQPPRSMHTFRQRRVLT